MLLQENLFLSETNENTAWQPKRDMKWREERKVEYFMNRMYTRLNSIKFNYWKQNKSIFHASKVVEIFGIDISNTIRWNVEQK